MLDVALNGQVGPVTLAIRPEQVSVTPPGAGIAAKIAETTYMGTDTHYTLALGDGSHVVARVQSNMADAFRVGDTVGISIGASAIQVLKS
jgi:spermidine/putrescine transport system ATP-binding protein